MELVARFRIRTKKERGVEGCCRRLDDQRPIALASSTGKARHSGGRARWLCLERCSSLRARDGFQGNEREWAEISRWEGLGKKAPPFSISRARVLRRPSEISSEAWSLTCAGRIFILRDRARLPEFRQAAAPQCSPGRSSTVLRVAEDPKLMDWLLLMHCDI